MEGDANEKETPASRRMRPLIGDAVPCSAASGATLTSSPPG